MESVSLLPLVRAGCRQALLAGLVAFAFPAAAHAAAPIRTCDPFCGVLRFMSPPAHHATTVAARHQPVRMARAVRARQPVPRVVYAAARPAPPAYARPYPRYVYWPVAYPAYGYPGYGYVYYYAYRVY